MELDWKAIISSVSPLLATALGGPLAGAAVKVIADKVLGKPDATESEVIEALSNGSLTGEQILALKSAEKSFLLEMEKIDAAREAAGLADVQSARHQTVSLAQADSKIAFAAPVISTIVMVGFFLCVAIILCTEKTWDERSANLINVLFGGLLAGFTQVINFWLGSSAGSKRSGDSLRAIAEGKDKTS